MRENLKNQLYIKNNRIMPKWLLLITLLSPFTVYAQGSSGMAEGDLAVIAILIIEAFLLLIFIYLLVLLRQFIKLFADDKKEAKSEVGQTVYTPVYVENDPGFLQKLKYKLTDAVPVEREAEVMTDHEYDGIRELDNNLPPWWKWLFYACIVFAVGYLAYYHIFDGKSSTEEYMAEMKEAEVKIAEFRASQGVLLDETNVELTTEVVALTEGEQIFVKNCVACHGQKGEGTIGPNLTDDYWLHGGSIKDVFSVIKHGVPAKGMIPWEKQLSAEQIQNVASYIYNNLHGTNPEGGKAPEGEQFARQ